MLLTNFACSKPAVSKLAASGLRALAEGLEKHSSWVDTSADSMAVDFMRYRSAEYCFQA